MLLPPLLLPIAISVVGLYLLVRLGAFPYLHPLRTVRAMLGGDTRSSLSALALALSGTLGVGNITGVTLALYAGGPGAILWMWVSALLAMPIRYAEVTLALDGKRFGTLHTACLLLLAPVLGGALQSSAAADALKSAANIPRPMTGAALAALAALVILGGSNRIRRAATALIPPLSLLYLFLTLTVILAHLSRLPAVLSEIFRSAFSFRAAGGGVLGTVSVGFSRGLLSNEAGCGTAPYAHAEASELSAARQGLFGIVEVGIDTLLLCTATALAILLPSGVGDGTLSPLLDTLAALLGKGAALCLSISLALFAYATTLAFSHYGERAVSRLLRSPAAPWLIRSLMTVAVALGSVLPVASLASLADLLLAVMTVLTLLTLIRHADRLVVLTRALGLIK